MMIRGGQFGPDDSDPDFERFTCTGSGCKKLVDTESGSCTPDMERLRLCSNCVDKHYKLERKGCDLDDCNKCYEELSLSFPDRFSGSKHIEKGSMQAFIGCKIILAEECSKESFDEAKKNGFPHEFDIEENTVVSAEQWTEGYHVVYPNPEGKRYHSWSPKEVFERSHRRVFTDEKVLISSY